MSRVWCLLWIGLAGCSGSPPTASIVDPEPLTADGLHNVFRMSDRVYSGSSPEGEAGFAELQRLGVKTILSVDGSVPDVALAEKHGLRYVHLPVGYDGIPRERVLEMARAVRDLPGPVYVHCHHGKHRGPVAASVIQLCLDPAWTLERAEQWLHTAGTDPKYSGLMAVPKSLNRPTIAELDAARNDFPSRATVPTLTRLMVEIDTRWDHLKLAKEAAWLTPKNHPDIDPPHEAVQLAELYREAARQTTPHGSAFIQLLTDAEQSANELATAIRKKDATTSNAVFTKSLGFCNRCHTEFRDRTQ